MKRTVFLLLGAGLLVLAGGELAMAQGWPAYGGNPLQREPGFYLAWWKILLFWLVFVFWVMTTDWLARDSQAIGDGLGLPAAVWNPIVVFSFLLGFVVLGLLIPVFAASFVIVLLAWMAPLGVYILLRNGRVGPDQKVLTPAHLKNWFGNLGKRSKRDVNVKLAYEDGPPIDISASGANDQENQANLITARQSPGFISCKELLADMILKGADRVMLDFTAEMVATRYEIDGIWHNGEPRERESSDIMLAVFKKICNLNINDRRARQEGLFKAKYQGVKYEFPLMSQGTQTGERVVLQMKRDRKELKTLEQLGMREKMREQLKQLLAAKNGFILFSSMPQGGLTTTWACSLNATDRLLRDFVSIEDKLKPTPDVENLEIITYNAAAGETADKIIPKVLLKHPDALLLPELTNAETVKLLCNETLKEGRMVWGAVRAKEAVEALMRVLLLKAPADQFAKAITAVVNQRLVRRLCDQCKMAYEPTPEMLQKLGIPPGRVQALYREWEPPQPGEERPKGEPEICPACNGIGYRGRVAMFELLVVNDQIRQALVSQPRLDVLRQVARQSGCRTLREEGILLVAQGVTSLNELQRVLSS